MEGVYHLAADGSCSWHEFASAIFEQCGMAPVLQAVTTADFGAPFARPAYSVLGSERVPRLRHWREGLRRYLVEKGHRQG